MLYAIIAGCLVLVAVGLMFWWRRRRRRSQGPVSVVLLRSSPGNLTAARVEEIAERLFGKCEVVPMPMPDGRATGYMLLGADVPPLTIIDAPVKYFGDEDAVASQIEDQTVRAVISTHTAWVSVDAFGAGDADEESLKAVHRILGLVAATLVDDDTLLFFLPHKQRVGLPGLRGTQLLRSGDFDTLFGDAALHQPMFQVAPDDRRIDKAIKTAQSRLPEFLGEFERRGSAAEAMFKARFRSRDESVECIWCTLKGVDSHSLTGVVENPPVADDLPAKGTRVKVRIDDVIDWAYLDEKGEPQGLFVDRILVSRGRR